jgi:hypothetical protein
LETKTTSNFSTGLLSSVSVAPYLLEDLLLDLFCPLDRPARARSVLNVLWEDAKRENVRLKASSDSAAVDSINCTRVDTSQL